MLPGRSIQALSVMPGLVPGISPGCLRRTGGRISPSGGFALREPQPSPPRRLPDSHIRSRWPHTARPLSVTPAPEPGSSLGSRGSLGGSACSPPAAAASEVGDGPRLGGRGDERGAEPGVAGLASAPDTSPNEMCVCGSPRRRGACFGFPGSLGWFGLLNTGCGSIADHGWTPAFAAAIGSGPDRRLPA